MSHKFLDHATDAITRLEQKSQSSFSVTADAVINLTLDQDKVEERTKTIFSKERSRYLLFSWLEEIPFVH